LSGAPSALSTVSVAMTGLENAALAMATGYTSAGDLVASAHLLCKTEQLPQAPSSAR